MQNEVQNIGLTKEAADKLIKNKDLALSLKKTRAYKKIIEELFMKEDVVRLVKLRSSLTLSESQKKNIDNMLHGPHALDTFLEQVIALGSQVEQDLKDSEAEKLEVN